MTEIQVSRSLQIPDLLRIKRYQKNPELGPKILFFSGGSAINPLCETLKQYTHNSIHLITPFDSGGSSAKLRTAFNMPAVGDLRSRLLALADNSMRGHPEILTFLSRRLPSDLPQHELRQQLATFADGSLPFQDGADGPMAKLVIQQLQYFLRAMPSDFDLRGACIGNLVLTGGYLHHHFHLSPIVFLFAKIANVLGEVYPIVDANLQVAAQMGDGTTVVGQHRLTGKEVTPIESPIERIFLTPTQDQTSPYTVEISPTVRERIKSADLIIYSPGSFYTSLIASLLPAGIADAIALNNCPKVWLPNLGSDPEQLNTDLSQRLTRLLDTLRDGLTAPMPNHRLLNFIITDQNMLSEVSTIPRHWLNQEKITVLTTELVSAASEPYYDQHRLAASLLSMT